MIKIINKRTLHEVLQEMRAQGVTLKDTEGFGINVDQSGHTYVVYMGEETETGIIDVSAGEAGVSSWFNSGTSAAGHSGYIEIGQIASSVTTTLTNTAGTNTWTGTVTSAGSIVENYIKPNTVTIAAVGSAPSVRDDGLGLLRLNNPEQNSVGTIDYDTGVISLTYFKGKAPASTDTVDLTCSISPLPNSSVFPKLVSLSHIVFVMSDAAATASFTLYNNDPARLTEAKNAVPSFFGTTAAAAQYAGSAEKLAEFFCDGRISINLNTLVTDRKVRWMKVAASAGYIKAVHVYWNRLST